MLRMKSTTIQNASVFTAGMMAASMVYSFFLGVANIPSSFAGSGMFFGFYTSGFNWIPVQVGVLLVSGAVYQKSRENKGQKNQ